MTVNWVIARWLAPVAAALAFWAISTAPARAGDPLVAFAETEKITTTCSKLEGEGVRVKIVNKTATAETPTLSFDLTSEDGQRKEPTAVCGGLELDSDAPEVPAKKSTVVTVKAKDAGGEGDASGFIVISDGTERLERRAFAVSAEKTSLEATPLVKSVSMDFEAGDSILIPVEELPKNGEAHMGSPVGAVLGPDGPFRVTYGGATLTEEEGPVVQLNVAGDPGGGTYSGQADLKPGVEGGEVSLALEVSSSVCLAIALLLFGILLGLLLQWFAGSLIPRARLLARVDKLSERAEEARKAAAKEGWKVEIENVDQLETDLRRKIRDTMPRGELTIKIDEKVLDSNSEAITVVEAEIDLLEDFPQHAQALQSALALPTAKVPALEDQTGRVIEAKARELLGVRSLEAEALKPWLERMDTRAEQVRSLRGHEGRLKALWLEAERIQKVDGTKDLKSVKEVLREASRSLAEAAGTEELAEALELLRRARDELVKLRASFPEGAAEALEGQEVEEVTLLANTSERNIFLSAYQLEPVGLEEQLPPPVMTKAEAKGFIARAQDYQWGVVAIAAVLAVASGLLAIYVGKTWTADWEGVLTAVTWGAVTQTALTFLIASLNDLGALRALTK